jgi:hypothetical protein
LPPNPALQLTASREIGAFLKPVSSALAAADGQTVGRQIQLVPYWSSVAQFFSIPIR